MLPFVNNVWLVQLTGAQIKSVLEQQWQPAGSAAGFLALDSRTTSGSPRTPTKPVGQRITSVLVNGTKPTQEDLHGQHVLLPGDRW